MKKTGMIVLILVILLLGWYYYHSSGKEDITISIEESSEQSELLVSAPKELPDKLPDGSGVGGRKLTPKEQREHQAQEGKESQENQESQQNQKERREQEEQIVEKYREKFLALQSEYSGKINALIGEALAEYKAAPEETRSEEGLYLGVKYLQKGSALEAECDARFNTILSQMQSELEASQLSLRGVQAAIEEYEGQKNARRSGVLSKAGG